MGFLAPCPRRSLSTNGSYEHQMPLNVVIQIYVPLEELLRRLAGRGREDDNRAIVAERLKQFDELTRPLLEYYRERGILHRIDGVGKTEDVFAKIMTAVEGDLSGRTVRDFDWRPVHTGRRRHHEP